MRVQRWLIPLRQKSLYLFLAKTVIGVDDMEGWVKTEYLLTGEEAAAYMQENGTLYARVTVPNMNIRLRPTTSADILDVAYEYDAYEVSLLESGWAYCVYDGPMKGYLSADCLAVSYSLGETWINTDIALTEDNAKQLGVAVSESSAENILLASANKVNTSTDISSDTTKEDAGSQEVLTVLSPDQVMAMASQAETVSSQQEESKVQQDTVPSSSAAAIEIAQQTVRQQHRLSRHSSHLLRLYSQQYQKHSHLLKL